MKIRIAVTIIVLGMISVVAGGYLAGAGLETVAAEPAPVTAKLPLTGQATTIEEVNARGARTEIVQAQFADDIFNYHLTYPLGWNTEKLSANRLALNAPDGTAGVTLEAVGPLPAGGLTQFVDRSLGDHIVLGRQLLTVHGLQAERVLAYSDEAGGQVTLFFIDAGSSAYVLTGEGDQKAVEMIARSFNVPQQVARR